MLIDYHGCMEKSMKDKEQHSAKETKRAKKLEAQEVARLANEKARAKTYLAREQEIEKVQKAKEAERAKRRANEGIKELAREKARKEAYLAKEKKIADGQEARKLRDKK